MILRILVGIIGTPLGFVLIRYRDKVKDFIGDISWAEQYLGAGGTWTAILLMGLGTSIFSLMFMLGTWQKLFIEYFGKFFL